MFMEYCNGGDLKDLMEIKKWNLGSEIIQTIMKQLVQGFNDMISVLVIHRDLKL
jgi:serine/threonine protein kinase